MKEPHLVFAAPVLKLIGMHGSDEQFPVRRVYCVGRNYAEHIREMGGNERDLPFFFQKPTDAVERDGARVPYPSLTHDFQHEVELVLGIGREGMDIAPENASLHVFAVAVGIDLTRRDLQVAARKTGRPWEIGKSFDSSAPCGNLLKLQGALPESGRIKLDVNGATRQQGDLAQMIWSASEIVGQLSRQYRLYPGDLIFTGTPAGVGPLRPGDSIYAEVDGLPPLEVSIGARISGQTKASQEVPNASRRVA
jgi:fumarylpyruvate hydrolase